MQPTAMAVAQPAGAIRHVGTRRTFFSSSTKAPPLRRSLVCAASSSDKQRTKREEKLKVPDAAPAGSSPPKPLLEERPQSEGELTVEQIQQRAAQLQAAQQQQQQQVQQPQAPGKETFWQGVLEEVFLIKWPTPKQAFLNTLLVIAIVGGTSGVLFAVNTLLAELSRIVYG